jgi:hypothetical protein
MPVGAAMAAAAVMALGWDLANHRRFAGVAFGAGR